MIWSRGAVSIATGGILPIHGAAFAEIRNLQGEAGAKDGETAEDEDKRARRARDEAGRGEVDEIKVWKAGD